MSNKLLHYDVLERLGTGAGSVIYAVADPVTKQRFALKHVVRNNPKDIRFVEQMETEFALSKQFAHPNLRRSYDLKINKSMLLKITEAYMVMELFEGEALDIYLPPSMHDVFDAFVQAAHGLKALHQMGYVHCDIKPNNILRDRAGRVKVIDFGQSCKIGAVKERIQGTPDYIAPEQVARKPMSIQTDVFNLGATLYWALTGKHIPTFYTIKKGGDDSLLSDDLIAKPIDLNPKIPQPVSNLITECISTRSSKRPADMDQVVARLEIGKHLLEKEAGKSAMVMDDTDFNDAPEPT